MITMDGSLKKTEHKSRMEIIKEVAKKKGIKVIDVPLGVFHLDEYSLWAPAEVIATCQRLTRRRKITRQS